MHKHNERIDFLFLRFNVDAKKKRANFKIRKSFTDLGLYEKKLKYYLSDHPIFGKHRCVHSHTLLMQWSYYNTIYPYIKDIRSLKVLEIGAGSGILAMLLNYYFDAKITIVDLPEMISYSSSFTRI